MRGLHLSAKGHAAWPKSRHHTSSPARAPLWPHSNRSRQLGAGCASHGLGQLSARVKLELLGSWPRTVEGKL